MTKELNVSPELMDAINAVLKARGGKRTKKAKGKGRVKPTPEETAARMAANDAECLRVFTEAGYKDVKPRINVLTHKKWVEKGRIVRKGEKSHKVGPFSLFHETQTDPLTVQEASDTKH